MWTWASALFPAHLQGDPGATPRGVGRGTHGPWCCRRRSSQGEEWAPRCPPRPPPAPARPPPPAPPLASVGGPAPPVGRSRAQQLAPSPRARVPWRPGCQCHPWGWPASAGVHTCASCRGGRGTVCEGQLCAQCGSCCPLAGLLWDSPCWETQSQQGATVSGCQDPSPECPASPRRTAVMAGRAAPSRLQPEARPTMIGQGQPRQALGFAPCALHPLLGAPRLSQAPQPRAGCLEAGHLAPCLSLIGTCPPAASTEQRASQRPAHHPQGQVLVAARLPVPSAYVPTGPPSWTVPHPSAELLPCL